MTKAKRMLSGMIVAAMVALSLIASGGDAYARVKSSGGHGVTNDTAPIPTATAPDLFQTLGVTWEE